jgi:hypothetical protein
MDRDTGPLRNLALGLLLDLWVTLSDGGGLLDQPGGEEKRGEGTSVRGSYHRQKKIHTT